MFMVFFVVGGGFDSGFVVYLIIVVVDVLSLLQWLLLLTGLHKLWYPGIRDMSTWSKFGAHGEHGDVFLFSNLGAL